MIKDTIRQIIESRHGLDFIREDNFRGDFSIYLRSTSLFSVVQMLVNSPEVALRYLKDITVVDWLGHSRESEGRYEIIYNFYLLPHKFRFFIKCHVPADSPEIASLTPLFNGANWMEREAWDLFGITFTGHPDLTKILTPDELDGHPLRRDFPLVYEVPHFTWNKDLPPEVIK